MQNTKDLNGKTSVITGATSGIGYEAARALAYRGAKIIGIGRSRDRIVQAQTELQVEFPGAQITYLIADLASQRQVRQLAEDIRKEVQADSGGALDVLINNAGTVSSWFSATEDGYELQFAVNHLAPFLLTYELMPLLLKAPGGRILTVSSNSHRNARIHWDDVMLRKSYHVLSAYKQSKVANVLFTHELNRRLGRDSHLRAFAIDPGLVNTQIGKKGTGGFVSWFWGRRSQRGASPEDGASTVVFVAADPSVDASSAVYWKDSRPKKPSRYAEREDEAERLWDLSERLCGIGAENEIEHKR